MHSLKSIVGLALCAVAFAFSGGVRADGPVTSSIMVPVDGLVFQPSGAFESIALTGRMHLVTQFQPSDPCLPTDPCRVFFDLADVKGVGLPSGNRYIAIGSVNASCTLSDPCLPSFTVLPVATGSAIPPNPIIPPDPIMPITFSVRIAFDASGRLSTEGVVVQLPGCSLDVCR